MKAIVVREPGPADVLKLGDVADPRPRPGEAVVRLRAAALNAADLWIRKPDSGLSLPRIPGCDGAGVLEEVNGDSPLDIGAEVVINPALPGNDPLAAARRPFGEIVQILGYDTDGTYAQRVAVPIQQLFPKPSLLDFREAAALPLTFLTAWRMLVTRGRVQAGEWVFVWGASGGLGSAGVKIASYLGARVIASVSSAEDGAIVREMGADHTVNYTEEDVAASVKDATKGAGVDVVFESVGERTWATSLSLLRPGGRLVIAGTTSGDFVRHDLSDIFYYQWSILGARMGDEREFASVLEMIGRGSVKPHVARSFPLAEAPEAQKLFESGDFVGKIVLDIP